MKKLILTFIMAIQLNPFNNSLAASEICNRDIFTHAELSEAYRPNVKTLETYSQSESEQIAQTIVENAKKESNSTGPCFSNSRSCFGQSQDWYYSRELILDYFYNPLRFNGKIESKKISNWPAGKYYVHQTQIGYSCSWAGNFPTQCKKWCSLVVNDDRFHD
jgi:hypothetical protein